MALPRKTESGFEHALRGAALMLPGVEEGVACKGTVVQSRTFKVRKKAFLFVRAANVMLKLEASAGEARRLASKDYRYRIGAGGWVTVMRDGEATSPPVPLMRRWIAESYRLYATDGKSAPKKPSKAKRR